MPQKIFRNIIVVAIGLAVTGYLRMPIEQEFTEDLRDRKVIPPRISQEVWGDLGQNSLAGTLGGLRTVMASITSMNAQTHFENTEWYELEKDYEVITALDPFNPFYWSTAGWHLGFNAASWAKTEQDLSPIERDVMEREFLEKGDRFYRRGLEHLPTNANLWGEIGAMWSNKYKRPDLPRAAEAYKQAAIHGGPMHDRRYLYTLARIPGREIEAYHEAQKMYLAYPFHLKIPTFRCVLFCLSTNPALPEDSLDLSIGEIWRSQEHAYQELFNYRYRVTEDGFYGGQLDQVLRRLIKELSVPDSLNPFKLTRPRRITDENWRRDVDRPKILRPNPGDSN